MPNLQKGKLRAESWICPRSHQLGSPGTAIQPCLRPGPVVSLLPFPASTLGGGHHTWP